MPNLALSLPLAKIQASGPGEALAILALVVPLLFAFASFFWQSNQPALDVLRGFGVIFLTAILLALDAHCLGPVDMRGRRRAGPVPLFFGLILLWVVFFPLAFFRRRHFGRPNLGLLAIVVAGLLLCAPALLEALPPSHWLRHENQLSCTSPEVKQMVNDMVRKSVHGPAVLSVEGYREISFDAASQKRTGQCLLKTSKGELFVDYQVRAVNDKWFEVNILTNIELHFSELSCTSPEVKDMVNDMIRKGVQGATVVSVEGHRETNFDAASKVRTGQCLVKTSRGDLAVDYEVKPVGDKCFAVKLLTHLEMHLPEFQQGPFNQPIPGVGQQFGPPGGRMPGMPQNGMPQGGRPFGPAGGMPPGNPGWRQGWQ